MTEAGRETMKTSEDARENAGESAGVTELEVGTNITAPNAGWTFENVADDFDAHVEKSVPLYNEGHELVCQLSDFFLHESSVVTELGTSTGVLARKFLHHNSGRRGLRYVGVDRESSMLEAASRECVDDRVSFVLADLVEFAFEPSSMIVSYYTMQFVHPRSRQELFTRIYESLEWGGALVLFEKVRAPDARFQDIAGQIYQEYKLNQHFSEAEILHKQRSLKGVLEPFSTQGNLDLMRRAGFVDMTTIMKWVCFEGFLAIK
jgi:tRNA (cmo5U34)-methyltransferase